MNVSRRWFIGGLAASGAAWRHRLFAAAPGTASSGRPRLVFGVVSDIHVKRGKGGVGFWPNYDPSTFKSALEYFRDSGVNAVVLPGDMADSGLASELKIVADTWYSVFPDDRAPDGRPVARVFVTGNHDWNGERRAMEVYGDRERCVREAITRDIAKNWADAFHEDWIAAYMKNVNGYTFFGANWVVGDCQWRDEIACAGARDFFLANIAKADPSLPFFFVQHPHPKDTCYGNWAWGCDDGTTTRILSPYANAVAFSGHSHYPLTDVRSLWQGAFTSIGCGSLRYIVPQAQELPPDGFENSAAPWRARRDELDSVKIPGAVYSYNTRHGMLVSVYDDRMVFARREFISGASLGDDWVMPLGYGERPFGFAERARKTSAPEFAPGAVLEIARGSAKNRGCKAHPREEKEIYRVRIPAAIAVKGVRALRYEIVASAESGRRMFHLLASGYSHPDGAPEALAPSTLAVACDRCPSGGKVRFTVRPVGVFGARGRAISGDI